MAVNCTMALHDHNRAQTETGRLHTMLRLASCQVFGKQTVDPDTWGQNCSAPLWVSHEKQRRAPSGSDLMKMILCFHSNLVVLMACGCALCACVQHIPHKASCVEQARLVLLIFMQTWNESSHMLALFWINFSVSISWTGAIIEEKQSNISACFYE